MELRSKAKVFVSCGQNSDEERLIVSQVSAELEKLGFEPYVAVQENTLNGLKDNIFRQLEDSEYFVFIDFKRERLDYMNLWDHLFGFFKRRRADGAMCRGSLFSHQELAVASYLGTQAVGFREEGVIPDEGMISALQLNCQEFTDRSRLPQMVVDRVCEKIKAQQWSSNWKAQLVMGRQLGDRGGSEADPPYIFHIRVNNQHWRKIAHGCRSFLSEVFHVDRGTGFRMKSMDLKWSGTKLPDVTILPGRRRTFDAFDIDPKEPTSVRWIFSHADTSKVWYPVRKPGKYHLTYVVTSQNFALSTAVFELDLRSDPRETTLTLTKSSVQPLA